MPVVVAPPSAPPPSAAAPAIQPQPGPGQLVPVRAVPLPVTEEIDLLDAAGGAVAKWAIPAIAGLLLFALIIRWWRRR